jgi:transcription factor C subunit 7
MPVQEILLLRHGHRLGWTFNVDTETYTSTHPYPSGLPADPPLASHGVRQSHETAAHLSELLQAQIKEDGLVIYSSLFYRCLETLRPSIEAFQRLGWEGKVRGERGVGEWFGSASFEQPGPGQWPFLRDRFFPWLEGRESRIVPSRYGESVDRLHNRFAMALETIIADVEKEYEEKGRGGEDVTVLICGHAAGIIASGRVLTGRMPRDIAEEDFKCFTCGLSRFFKRDEKKKIPSPADGDTTQATGDWRVNGGVAGGWDCVLNSDCEHLTQGEERGWHFFGDESFDSYGPSQDSAVEGIRKQKVEDTSEERSEGPKL